MKDTKHNNLPLFLDRVRNNSLSTFYKDHWGGEEVFEKLPLVCRADFERVPLSKRRYKNEKGLVKIVHGESQSFMSEWSFLDIQAEAFGVQAARPLVYLQSPHEAIEKSMWCYEHNMVPLIGEKILDVVVYAAEKYKVDSLITDAPSLLKLEPYLRSRSPLESISIIGEHMVPEELVHVRPYARETRLVCALPETGAFAEAVLSLTPEWVPLPDCILENRDTLVVTKIRDLVTPVVRYKTNISPMSFV